ncbi:MAG: methionyl-tRNA formyltransferase [Alphaproteobacteria bacterium]|nr:methionyl-tRNA formyltransferase [Alphaproteobacteria bacterium]
MRLAFLGTPEFALPTLAELIAAGHEIACVYTRPPRPAHRGQKENPSPVQRFAEAHAIPVRTPLTLKTEEAAADFRALDLDAAVVVAYGLILPPAILAAPRLGCLNVHASLLPRWRGAAPIQRALLAGDRETGVTIMQMEEGLDTGPMLLAERLPIGPRMTAGALHDALAALGASLMPRVLAALERDAITPVPQPAAGVTYAAKITKAEAELDWTAAARDLDARVRALAPSPGAFFRLSQGGRELRVKVLDAEPVAGPSAPPGTVVAGLTIACGEGALKLLRVQREGRAPVDAEAFLRGTEVPPGTVLPTPGRRA